MRTEGDESRRSFARGEGRLMAVVTTPVEGWSGESVCGVVFTDGTAETDDPAALRYFEAAGYTVTDDKPKRTRK